MKTKEVIAHHQQAIEHIVLDKMQQRTAFVRKLSSHQGGSSFVKTMMTVEVEVATDNGGRFTVLLQCFRHNHDNKPKEKVVYIVRVFPSSNPGHMEKIVRRFAYFSTAWKKLGAYLAAHGAKHPDLCLHQAFSLKEAAADEEMKNEERRMATMLAEHAA